MVPIDIARSSKVLQLLDLNFRFFSGLLSPDEDPLGGSTRIDAEETTVSSSSFIGSTRSPGKGEGSESSLFIIKRKALLKVL